MTQCDLHSAQPIVEEVRAKLAAVLDRLPACWRPRDNDAAALAAW